MIRVAKSDNVPVVLTEKGVQATVENCRLYEINPNAYDKGATKFKINSDIYGHLSVKELLIFEQHGKCCFCEADFTANGYGDVEHFRPKAGFTKTLAGKLNRPGYYWLAYDWSNLFFSCQICNQRYKKNYFPLEDETQRAKNHTFDYEAEVCQLVHPSKDNPEDHITFNRHVPVAKDKRGKLSINGYGIDRPKLNTLREAHLQNVRNNIFLAGFDPTRMSEDERDLLSRQSGQPWPVIEGLIQTAKAFVAVATDNSQPFSAMVRANFPDLI
ncbi:hypothetical protein DYU11_16460 [Fibrisoma montanum]|uniref:TIGR02646 family protein n=1 Tax=Fibrisoma montanum TaxID=2305895 RepID=A0A418M924_9BACT|nr:hypothetical protein [Fibrisoma montanum]RIV22601.1 hypothetical protein DYU11_16460 [Fibrisoma montanum]